ncbi:MAG: cysteine-rich CWC family protein [candidate division WOR-3 bacterium]
MPQHEIKICPRCQSQFECKLGSINLCQCTAVRLDDTERAYIREQFEDCLCAACLLSLKKERKQKVFEQKIEQIFDFLNFK